MTLFRMNTNNKNKMKKRNFFVTLPYKNESGHNL